MARETGASAEEAEVTDTHRKPVACLPSFLPPHLRPLPGLEEAALRLYTEVSLPLSLRLFLQLSL